MLSADARRLASACLPARGVSARSGEIGQHGRDVTA